MSMTSNTTQIEEVRRNFLASAPSAQCGSIDGRHHALLFDKMLKYNWVGFYMLEPAPSHPCWCLGIFRDDDTAHAHSSQSGICGAAASSGRPSS